MADRPDAATKYTANHRPDSPGWGPVGLGGTNSNSFGLFDRNTAALVDVDSAVALTGGPAVPPP